MLSLVGPLGSPKTTIVGGKRYPATLAGSGEAMAAVRQAAG